MYHALLHDPWHSTAAALQYQVLRITAPVWQSVTDDGQQRTYMLELAYSKERQQISLTLDQDPVMVYPRSCGEDITLTDEKAQKDNDYE